MHDAACFKLTADQIKLIKETLSESLTDFEKPMFKENKKMKTSRELINEQIDSLTYQLKMLKDIVKVANITERELVDIRHIANILPSQLGTINHEIKIANNIVTIPHNGDCVKTCELFASILKHYEIKHCHIDVAGVGQAYYDMMRSKHSDVCEYHKYKRGE